MRQQVRQLALVLVLAIGVSSCTDKRTARKIPVEIENFAPETLVLAADRQYNGKPISVFQMLTKGNSIYMTGTEFGFSRWDLSSNPEDPQHTFAAATQIDRFLGKWVLDWWTTGALTILGNVAFISGSVGASAVDLSETTRPRELRRFPTYTDSNPEVQSDDAYIWTAVVANPSQPILYAFRKQDYMLTMSVNGSNLTPILKENYGNPGETVCCVNGAAVFQNKVFVAFRSRLVFFDIGMNGQLTNYSEFGALHAVNVVATANKLYVQHEPSMTTGPGASIPRGIYVFDQQGKNVAFLESSPLVFTVSSNDSHLYANMDDQSVQIYRIQWQ